MENRRQKIGFQAILSNGRIVNRFTTSEKQILIKDWQRSGRTKRDIWEKYTGH
ncbi:MAG: hypothetical protein ACI9AT_000118 [Ulvibacter sp.]|jgi:hypothetical protein